MSHGSHLWFMRQKMKTTARLSFVSDTMFLQHTYGIQATIDHTHFKGVGKRQHRSIIRGGQLLRDKGRHLEDVIIPMTLREGERPPTPYNTDA